jgi:CO/xanthine dehydrogenase Mo-binding subunit
VTSFCAQVAEVEVDRETGQMTILRLVTAHDVGTIINPLGHQGQIEGGLIQGMGFAVMEEVAVEEGRVSTLSLGDYKLPTIKDVPPLDTVILEEPVGPGPFAGKSIGEGSISPMPAALANALADACGVRLTSLPLTAEKIYAALAHERQTRASEAAP